mmetsp:Transcript_35292/g.106221  ORF Transcript_35292/g.106221 Transcript_35292/m.106221 type:complete len:245 (-) Transcript_35292:180-914(-)
MRYLLPPQTHRARTSVCLAAERRRWVREREKGGREGERERARATQASFGTPLPRSLAVRRRWVLLLPLSRRLRLLLLLETMRHRSPNSVSETAPLVIHILPPLSSQLPSACCSARVRIPSTSVPASGSDMPMPPIASPEHAAGSQAAFCSAEPLRARLLTKSCEWARYERQKAGSDADSSSCTMQAAAASMPAPPYSGSTVTPSSPSSPARRKSGWLNRSARLNSSACGSTSSRTNAAHSSRSA